MVCVVMLDEIEASYLQLFRFLPRLRQGQYEKDIRLLIKPLFIS